MNVLLILNDPPVLAGRSESGLRLAEALLRMEVAVVRVFLLGDAVRGAEAAAAGGEGHGPGYRVSVLINAGAIVAVSASDLRDRRITPGDLVIGAEQAGLATLAAWCMDADRQLVF
jgi:uncharacterized protein involved in oxidation of intracellular sulfur